MNEIVIKLVLIITINLGLVFVLSHFTSLIKYESIKMLVNMTVCALLFMMTAYFWGLNNKERELIKRFINKKVRHKD